MELAERLYSKGFISYPRTETNCYGDNVDLLAIVQELSKNKTRGKWGSFARKLLTNGKYKFMPPRNGKLDDNAHPPIHPVLDAPPNTIDKTESKLYELICRHFLATCSTDAQFFSTKVTLKVGDETFTTSGQQVDNLGYLLVFGKYSQTTI